MCNGNKVYILFRNTLPGCVNTFLSKSVQLSFLPRIQCFGLPISVTWPVYRTVNDKESSLGIGLKGILDSSESSEWPSYEPKTYRRVTIMTEIFRWKRVKGEPSSLGPGWQNQRPGRPPPPPPHSLPPPPPHFPSHPLAQASDSSWLRRSGIKKR